MSRPVRKLHARDHSAAPRFWTLCGISRAEHLVTEDLEAVNCGHCVKLLAKRAPRGVAS